ncbi:MAG: hypothetical protein COX81_02385 [Candidatus Magasanikbacteria bacterium CG_4_10_14_0_2_um_filter_37_12]|uniref:Prepilin peptidase n=1 Tax=Candidatus Magasanikbacteria bacterium CG_4_10_14_0_2_um_filter_37_12 TaxID=1974637 RepID=A0A2M7V7X8_9BACT|nr:MAG: hypothetical protein COX81_02385 [Candidatus Magasanikbacteria bacterium CG_4_10_14_0_2_um_filter_37_12]
MNYLFIFILGIIFGSFLNVFVWRTRERMSLIFGRSICPQCQKHLKWFHNIPLFSFIFLKGKCVFCLEKISWQYPLVEFFLGILFVFTAYFYSFNYLLMARDFFILFFLLAIFVYDLQYQEIWDRMTIFPAIVVFFFSLVFSLITWQSMVFGILFGWGFFLLQFIISQGKWIGGGDIRLGIFMGVVLSWPLILLALMLAYVFGAIFSAPLLIMKKKTLASKVPFGTYLCVATFVAMYWGMDVIYWYIGLL